MKYLHLTAFIIVLNIKNASAQPITLRMFSILKGETRVSQESKDVKIFNTGLYLELGFDTSDKIFTLQFGKIKTLKVHVFLLKGINKDLTPFTPDQWITSVSSETKNQILQKLKSLTSFTSNKVITSVSYPSEDTNSFPIFLLNCRGDQSSSADGKPYFEADPKIEQKLAENLLKDKKLLFSFLPNNISVYRTSSKEFYYRLLLPKRRTFNHANLLGQFHFYIYYKGESLSDLTPIKLSFATGAKDIVLFTHTESSESKDQYLTTLSSAIEKSLKPGSLNIPRKDTFKLPTVNKYVPVSRVGAFISYLGNAELKKYKLFNRNMDFLDKFLNGLHEQGKIKEGGWNLDVDKEEKKVLSVFGEIEGMEKYVKGFEFDMDKKYGDEEVSPEVVDKGSGKVWKWVLGVGASVLVLGVVGGLVWIKFVRGKLSYGKS